MMRPQIRENGFEFEQYLTRLQHDAEKKSAEKRKTWERISKLKRSDSSRVRYKAW